VVLKKLKNVLGNVANILISLALFLVIVESALTIVSKTGAWTNGSKLARLLKQFNSSYVDDRVGWSRHQKLYRPSENTKLSYEHIPGVTVDHIKINSDGFRGREYSKIPDPDVYRIAVVGDSETFGMRLPSPETFPAQLRSHLSAKEQARFEVLNFGVAGYSTDQEMELIRTKVLDYHPNMVLVYFCFNDPELHNSNVVLGDSFWQRTKTNVVLSYYTRKLEGHDHHRGLPGQTVVSYYQWLYESSYFEKTKHMLSETGRLLREKKIPLVLVVAPEIALSKEEFAAYPYRVILEKLKGLHSPDMQVIDPTEALLGKWENPQTLWVSEDDPHKNAIATGVIADFVSARLLPQIRKTYAQK
jgi:hypothetical protein